MAKTKIDYVIGEASVTRNGNKERLDVDIGSEDSWFTIRDGDMLETESDSYVVHIQEYGRSSGTNRIGVGPNTKLAMKISGGVIEQINLEHGHLTLTANVPVATSLATVKCAADKSKYADESLSVIRFADEQMEVANLGGAPLKVQNNMSGETISVTANTAGDYVYEQLTVSSNGSKLDGITPEMKSVFNKIEDQLATEKREKLMKAMGADNAGKRYVQGMEKMIANMRQDIEELEKEGGAPKELKRGVKKLEMQLSDAKKELREKEMQKQQEAVKKKEHDEWEKKFEAREKQFERDLEKMATEVDSQSSSTPTDGLTDLERKIQQAGAEIDTEEDSGGLDSDFSDLEKKIEAAGKELDEDE
ncbi:MAG: hypothetical protein GF309_09280 [Candidatus Lokiarchaeota archaeon]|nr:hypothetical protein [Candidatus Lokiarchaeota archaeon]